MDEVEQLLSDKIALARRYIKISESLTLPRNVVQGAVLYWEGELTNCENLLSEYRLKKSEEKRSNVLPFRRRLGRV